jgi:hypothetical protein
MAVAVSVHHLLLMHAETARRDMSTGARIAGRPTVPVQFDPTNPVPTIRTWRVSRAVRPA